MKLLLVCTTILYQEKIGACEYKYVNFQNWSIFFFLIRKRMTYISGNIETVNRFKIFGTFVTNLQLLGLLWVLNFANLSRAFERYF